MASLADIIRDRRKRGLDILDSRTGMIRGAPKSQRATREERLKEAQAAIDAALGTESVKTVGGKPNVPVKPATVPPGVNPALVPGASGVPGKFTRDVKGLSRAERKAHFTPEEQQRRAARSQSRALAGISLGTSKATGDTLDRLLAMDTGANSLGLLPDWEKRKRKRSLSQQLRA